MEKTSSTATTDTVPKSEPTLKVFVSYSRSDLEFADEIASGLEFHGDFEVLIDRESIHEGEKWKERLGNLIASADTIVFILSPASATSLICAWEVGEAERLSKRILPVQAVPLGAASPPPQLAALNYVRFDPNEDGRPRSFIAGLAALCRALNTDIDWLREHTRLLSRAREWISAGRIENRLLLGEDIANAKTWLENKPKDAPAPTELHHEFIAESEKHHVTRLSAERKRAKELEAAVSQAKRAARNVRRALIASIVLLIGVGAAGAVAYRQMLVADAEQQKADNALKAAVEILRSGSSKYVELFKSAAITPARKDDVSWYVNKLIDPENRRRYEAVGQATGTPWFVISILHGMETSFNFRSHLHNGDPLSRHTRRIPEGRPLGGTPPFTWEESAIDAIKLYKFDGLKDWSLAKTLFRFEAYNGFRSRLFHNTNSPYLWSCSNHYVRGKYVSGGKWSDTAVSKQCGAATMLRVLVNKGIVKFPDLENDGATAER